MTDRPPNAPPPRGPRPDGPRQPAPGRGMMMFVAMALLGLMVFMLFQTPGGGKPITLREFESLWAARQIDEDSVVVRDSSVTARQKKGVDSDEATGVVINVNAADREYVAREVYRITNGRVSSKRTNTWFPVLVAVFGPVIIFVLLIWFFLGRAIRSAGGGGGVLGNFGKSKHRTLTREMTGITFKDVAGIEEAKEEVSEIIEFLRNPKKFTRLGGRIPRGVLLTGPPGCGKTLLAKAIAGEADVPFFSISGSDFVEMFVGVGASRVRDLFKQAKESSPCIIFLDEIDAVGRRRGSGFNTGGHDEREQTLNAILVEMDGFTPSDGVIVIAATNRPDVLDPALIRPGRFDRQIAVPLPDIKGRVEILTVHAKRVKMGPGVDIERLAKLTPMFSGADLAAIINEAAIAATMQNKDYVEQSDLEEARDKVRFGRAKKSRVREKEDNRLAAYHEAGHTVLQMLLPEGDPLHKVTIIPRGDAGGATFSMPEKDRMGYGLKWLNATMRVLCGGRIAEQRAMDDISTGAAMDIAQVTSLARAMIVEWGMSEKLGFVRYAGADTREMQLPDKEYSDETARVIDEEVRRIVDEAYRDAARLIEAHWEQVVRVAEALLRHETLSRDDVDRLMKGETLHKATISDLLAAEARKAGAEARPPARPSTPESDLPPGMSPTPA